MGLFTHPREDEIRRPKGSIIEALGEEGASPSCDACRRVSANVSSIIKKQFHGIC